MAKKRNKKKTTYGVTSLKQVWGVLKENKAFLVLLAFITLGIYINSLNGEFVSDDIGNFVLRKDFEDISNIFQFKYFNYQGFMYFVAKAVSPQNPFLLHIASVMLHLVTSVLFFIFTFQIFGKKPAILATLLFSVHSINSETVSWISANPYIFTAIANFGTLILFTIYKESGNKKYYWASFAFYSLNIVMTKNPWTLTIPFILVVVDQFFLEPKINIKKSLKYVPFMIISLAYAFFVLASDISTRVEVVNVPRVQKPSKATTIPYTIGMTTKLLFWPKELTLYHEGENVTMNFINISRAFTILLPIFIAYLYIKKDKKVAGLVLGVYVAILPALSPVQIAWYMAERYLYISSGFFAILVVNFLLNVEHEFNSKKFASYVVAFLVFVLSIRTVVRNADWKTRKSLWIATAKQSPGSPKVHNNLGDIYAGEANYEKSLAHFQRAIDLDPTFAEAHHNKGRTYLLIKDYKNAKQKFLDALKINPNIFQSYYMLGVLEFEQGNLGAAEQYLLKSLELDPGNQQTVWLLGLVHEGVN